MGCGTGLSFGLIEQRIGSTGQLVGIELSPEMLAVARERIRRHRWTNVTLIESAIEDARIGAQADAALFCLVHDITRSRPALENVLAQLKPGGRIGVFGVKEVSAKFLPLSLLTRRVMAPFITTRDGAERPWTLLAGLDRMGRLGPRHM